MSMDSYSFSFLGKILSLALVATGCSASGAASSGETGGKRTTTGGKASTAGGGTGSTDTSAGGNPSAGGTGNATGGAGTGGNATGGMPCVAGTQIGSAFSTNYFVMGYSQLSPFYVFNNGWSTTATALTTAGTQESVSAFETCTPGTISWSTTYNWAGDTSSVRAYPAAILGWHNTKGFKYDSTLTGLPKTISSLTSVKCSWDFTTTGGAAQNVSFDLWVHSTACNATAVGVNTAPSDEIMIWLYSSGGVNPIGYNGAGTAVSAAGANWSLYNGNVSSWAVHSFVRQGTTTSVQDLDILALLKTSSLGLSSKCLTSIEAGTEVYNGSGTLKTNSYKCTVQ